ncbi:MAG: alpha/beta fold hydrolase [Desulfamplus sp.]|nr:alpha/beta fold hydrolase [Desulfamplus sp.]
MTKRIINNKETSTKGFEHLYPFKSNFLTINRNRLNEDIKEDSGIDEDNINGHGYKMHYLDEGIGKPVLMLHGNPTWSFYFRHLVKELSAKGYRTIVPDHIGCGFSDKPSASNYDYTLKSRVQDINSLVNQLKLKSDEKISLIVHDWGGMIGLFWALQNFERIDKIVITNTSGFFLPSDKRFPFRLWLIKYLRAFAIPGVLGLNIFSRAALYMAPFKKLPKDVKRGLVAPYNSWKNRVATLKFVQDIPITEKDRSYELVKYVDTNLPKLKKIPMVILWGEHDFVFDLSFLREWKLRFPKVSVYLFKDAGHYLFEDKPHETCEIIKKFFSNY